MSKIRVVIGLSGGVDSAVSAAVLVERGYQVTGVFLECWKEPGCRTDEDRKDALAVALKLKVPFKVLDFKREYKQKVVDYFYSEYKAGRTPNPDVMCNQEIKFGLFYDWVMKQGFDYVATGHYAKIVCAQKSVHPDFFRLMIPEDKHKDQTYFLYRLRREQLAHILFPLADLTKAEVRKEARERGLPVAEKPDSQGICFIGEVNINQFLRERLPVERGEVVDTRGRVIGEHDGAWFYTIGQRHGFRTGGGKPPMYVINNDVKKNRLVVGFGAETYRDQFTVSDVNWLTQMPNDKLQTLNLRVRIRHGGELIPAEFRIYNSEFVIHLVEPQRGIAPGQSAVVYDGDVVLGGGVIS